LPSTQLPYLLVFPSERITGQHVSTKILSSSEHIIPYKKTAIQPIPVAALSKAWFCGVSLAEIVGSNAAGGIDVSCEFCGLSEVSASG